MYRRSLILPILLLALPLSAHEEQTDSTVVDRVLELRDVVVTGTRTPKLLKDTPVLTRVITASDIERTDATNVMDLLQQELSGVEFSYAMNQQRHLNISGFGGQGILFLVDGERLAGETMDDVDFTRLTMGGVERVEIVKGAASALYGSNATGGVINIITKKVRQPWTLNVSGRYGRHGEQRYGASWGLSSKHWTNLLTAHYNAVDNYRVSSAANPVTQVVSTIYGDKTCNVREQLTWQPSERLSVTGRAGYFFRQVQRTPDIPERYRDMTGGLRLNWTISDADVFEASYAFDQYDKSDYQRIAGLDIRDYSNVQNTLRALYSHSFGRGDVLTLGADYLHDYLFNLNLRGRKLHQDCLDAFAQYDWQIDDRWELVSALRYDWFSDAHHARLTPKVNVRYRPLSGLALRGCYGMGFRAPTLKERYYDSASSGVWYIKGNPDLKPEVSHNFSVSAEYSYRSYNVTGAAYYNIVSEKLSVGAPYFKTPDDRLPYLPYSNLDHYSVYGGEVSVRGRWACGLSAHLTYAYTHEALTKDKEGQTISTQYIPARPHALHANVNYDHAVSSRYAIGVGLSGRLLSRVANSEYRNYYDLSEGRVMVHYPAYTLWKLSLVQTFYDAFRLTVAVDNVFNYRPRYHYFNAPLTDGAWLQVGLSVDIDRVGRRR